IRPLAVVQGVAMLVDEGPLDVCAMLPELAVDRRGAPGAEHDLRFSSTALFDQRDAKARRGMRVVESRRFEPRCSPPTLALTFGHRVEVLDGAVEQTGMGLAAKKGSALDQSAEGRVQQQALMHADDGSPTGDLCRKQVRVVLGALRIPENEVDLEE